MATKSPLRLATLSRRPFRQTTPTTTTKRTFLSSLLAGNDKPLHINVSRTLPYPRGRLYDLIADVDSYSQFLPYCKHSRVTAWATDTTDENNSCSSSSQQQQQKQGGKGPTTTRRWPSAGELSLGWGPVDHTYTSRIVCVPGTSVEAHSGQDEPLCRSADERRGYRNPFRKLRTRWTLREGGEEQKNNHHNHHHTTFTMVELGISMTLRDPMAQAVLSQMVDGVAEEMIQAFERRAEELFGEGQQPRVYKE